MKLTFLEKLIMWLAKLAQIVEIVKSNPASIDKMKVFEVTGNHGALSMEKRIASGEFNPDPPAGRAG
jgi:hypothetical protein